MKLPRRGLTFLIPPIGVECNHEGRLTGALGVVHENPTHGPALQGRGMIHRG